MYKNTLFFGIVDVVHFFFHFLDVLLNGLANATRTLLNIFLNAVGSILEFSQAFSQRFGKIGNAFATKEQEDHQYDHHHLATTQVKK